MRWYSSITFRFLTCITGGHSFTMDLLDLIDAVHRGERDGDIQLITSQARRVLQDKFSSGYFQDFPVENRRNKEAEINPRPKRAGYKGGRGGVNARRRRGVRHEVVGDEVVGDVHLDDDVFDEVGDNGGDHLGGKGGDYINEDEAGHHDVGDHEVQDRVVDPTPPDSYDGPNWKLFSSSDFCTPHEQPPTGQKKLPTEQQQSPTEQQQPPLEQPPQQHMKLRTRRHKGPTCGTGGHKDFQHYTKRLKLPKK